MAEIRSVIFFENEEALKKAIKDYDDYISQGEMLDFMEKEIKKVEWKE